MHAAVACGCPAAVHALATRRPDLLRRVDRKRRTAFHVAAISGYPKVTQLLLDLAADPNQADAEGRQPLHHAVLRGYEKVVKAICNAEVDLEQASCKKGMTALHIAAANGQEGIVEMLLERRADFTARSASGRTAMHIAARQGHSAALAVLMQRGQEVCLQPDGEGDVPADLAKKHGHMKALAMLEPAVESYHKWQNKLEHPFKHCTGCTCDPKLGLCMEGVYCHKITWCGMELSCRIIDKRKRIKSYLLEFYNADDNSDGQMLACRFVRDPDQGKVADIVFYVDRFFVGDKRDPRENHSTQLVKGCSYRFRIKAALKTSRALDQRTALTVWSDPIPFVF